MTPEEANELAESRQQRKERVARERYARVRDYDHRLYGDIAAFAATFAVPGYEGYEGSQDLLAMRAKVESYCIAIVARILDQEGAVK